MRRRKWWQSRSPFWHWLLRVVAWAVLIAFVFTVIVSSVFTVVKVLQQ